MFIINREAVDILRAKRGLTLEKLAKQSGKHVSSLSKLLSRGRCHPATAYWLAEALGVEISDIAELEKK